MHEYTINEGAPHGHYLTPTAQNKTLVMSFSQNYLLIICTNSWVIFGIRLS